MKNLSGAGLSITNPHFAARCTAARCIAQLHSGFSIAIPNAKKYFVFLIAKRTGRDPSLHFNVTRTGRNLPYIFHNFRIFIFKIFILVLQSNSNTNLIPELRFEPLSKKNWPLFETLFGEKGACGGCWCMHFRLPKKEWESGKKNGDNKMKMQRLVDQKIPSGFIAVYQNKAIAWAALAPREDFVKLAGSRIHKPIDDKKVWSIPCTFIHKNFRQQGVSVALLKGIIEYAKKQKINILEAYPTIPSGKLPDAFAWIGLYKSFQKAGFEIVDQKSPNRPMVRYYLTKK